MKKSNEEWLRDNLEILKLHVIEKNVGCPVNTIQKWIKGERKINDKWDKILDEYLNGLLGNDRIVMVPVIEEMRERILKEEKDSPDPLLAVKRMITEKGRLKIKTKGKEMVNDIPLVNKNSVPIDMTTVDVVTGEIKEKLVVIRPNWLFNRVESTYEVVEPWISKSGNIYEAKRMFGNRLRYLYVTNLEDARRLVHAKNPLMVELSIK